MLGEVEFLPVVTPGFRAWACPGDRSCVDKGAMALPLSMILADLKQTTQSATDLREPWDRFHDDFAMVAAFARQGEPAENDRIERALVAATKSVLGGAAHEVRNEQFMRLSRHNFWHGTCEIGPRTVIFYYYDDINVGIAGLFRSFEDPRVTLVRISLLNLPAGGFPGRRPAPGTVQ